MFQTSRKHAKNTTRGTVHSFPPNPGSLPAISWRWSQPSRHFPDVEPAYTLQENLLIPFTGVDCNDVAHDAFNFYMS